MADGEVKKHASPRRGAPHKGVAVAKKRGPAKPVGKIPLSSPLAGSQDVTRPLTERQRTFVNLVVRDKLNYAAAARQAGFANNSSTVHALLANAKVAHAIAVEREEFARASAMTKKKVMDGFMEAIDMAKLKADPMVMVAGWREVAKMCGFYEPTKHKLEVSVNGQVVIQKLQQLDDEALLKLADGNADALDGEFTVIDA